MPNPTDSALTPLPNWPILLTTELAARYLSIDENTFAMLAETSNLEPVDLGVSLIRWRRSELDRLVAKLPAVVWAPETRASNAKELDQASIERIVQGVASRVVGIERPEPRLMMSMKETAKTLGISHSTLYKLVSAGRLQTHRLGGRTLVRRADVEALFKTAPESTPGRKGRSRRV